VDNRLRQANASISTRRYSDFAYRGIRLCYVRAGLEATPRTGSSPARQTELLSQLNGIEPINQNKPTNRHKDVFLTQREE